MLDSGGSPRSLRRRPSRPPHILHVNRAALFGVRMNGRPVPDSSLVSLLLITQGGGATPARVVNFSEEVMAEEDQSVVPVAAQAESPRNRGKADRDEGSGSCTVSEIGLAEPEPPASGEAVRGGRRQVLGLLIFAGVMGAACMLRRR